jgi:hypothetical protein
MSAVFVLGCGGETPLKKDQSTGDANPDAAAGGSGGIGSGGAGSGGHTGGTTSTGGRP